MKLQLTEVFEFLDRPRDHLPAARSAGRAPPLRKFSVSLAKNEKRVQQVDVDAFLSRPTAMASSYFETTPLETCRVLAICSCDMA